MSQVLQHVFYLGTPADRTYDTFRAFWIVRKRYFSVITAIIAFAKPYLGPGSIE